MVNYARARGELAEGLIASQQGSPCTVNKRLKESAAEDLYRLLYILAEDSMKCASQQAMTVMSKEEVDK